LLVDVALTVIASFCSTLNMVATRFRVHCRSKLLSTVSKVHEEEFGLLHNKTCENLSRVPMSKISSTVVLFTTQLRQNDRSFRNSGQVFGPKSPNSTADLPLRCMRCHPQQEHINYLKVKGILPIYNVHKLVHHNCRIMRQSRWLETGVGLTQFRSASSPGHTDCSVYKQHSASHFSL
jgi:hypothetical protein